MAVQMHVAHSSIMRGVGVIAGVAYDCADSGLTVSGRLLRLPDCLDVALSMRPFQEPERPSLQVSPVLSTILHYIFLAKKYGCFPGITTVQFGAQR